jgi:hypothetical protein
MAAAIPEEKRRLIRKTLSEIYGEAIPPVKTKVKECWLKGTKEELVDCLAEKGKVLGAEMKKAWGKE